MSVPDIVEAKVLRDSTAAAGAPQRASLRFMLRHPAYCIALGHHFGIALLAQ